MRWHPWRAVHSLREKRFAPFRRQPRLALPGGTGRDRGRTLTQHTGRYGAWRRWRRTDGKTAALTIITGGHCLSQGEHSTFPIFPHMITTHDSFEPIEWPDVEYAQNGRCPFGVRARSLNGHTIINYYQSILLLIYNNNLLLITNLKYNWLITINN